MKKAQITLSALDALNGRATTTQLVDHTPFPKRGSVHHQLKEYLIPAGLVVQVGTEEVPGTSFDVNVWFLTEEGVEFVEDHRTELATHLSHTELVHRYYHLRRDFEELSESLDTLEKRIRLHEDDSVPYHVFSDFRTEAGQKFAATNKEVNQIDERLIVTESGTRTLNQKVVSFDKRLEELKGKYEERFNRIHGILKKRTDEIENLQSEVSKLGDELRNIRDSGLLSRLKRGSQ